MRETVVWVKPRVNKRPNVLFSIDLGATLVSKVKVERIIYLIMLCRTV